eukprot:1914779-Prymnesium_polylepis.1
MSPLASPVHRPLERTLTSLSLCVHRPLQKVVSVAVKPPRDRGDARGALRPAESRLPELLRFRDDRDQRRWLRHAAVPGAAERHVSLPWIVRVLACAARSDDGGRAAAMPHDGGLDRRGGHASVRDQLRPARVALHQARRSVRVRGM